MKIETYVKKNWDTLPKSHFNDDEVVIVQEFSNRHEGYGHHSYSGVGIDKTGEVYYCYSSGCSCSGSCGMDHAKTAKVLPATFDLSALKAADIDFKSIEVGFSDYD